MLGLFISLLVIIIIGVFVMIRLDARDELKKMRLKQQAQSTAGVWNIADYSRDNRTEICLVRVDGNIETGRIPIGAIAADDPNWSAQYESLVAEARQRMASLQAEK
jgi:hypothetical protein